MLSFSYSDFSDFLFSAKAKEQQGKRTDIKQNSAESKPIETRKELAKVANVSELPTYFFLNKDNSFSITLNVVVNINSTNLTKAIKYNRSIFQK
jgi:hypothetical protein